MDKDSRIKKIEFDLIENGLDFILSSLEPILNGKSQNQLKYSILHISAGVELILKERLKNEHWTLIFDNINSANPNDLISGDFHSVNLDTAILRLENICGIELGQKAKSYLKELKKRRNKIEHFQFKEIDSAIKSLVSKVLSTVFSFIIDQFEYSELTKNSKAQIDVLRGNVKNFNEFTHLRLAQIKDDLEFEGEQFEVVNCPKCYQEALPISDDLRCLFCGFTDSPSSVAELFVENIQGYNRYREVKDGGHFPLDICIECQDESMVEIDDVFICFSCHESWKREYLCECDICGSLCKSYEGAKDICDSCESGKYSR